MCTCHRPALPRSRTKKHHRRRPCCRSTRLRKPFVACSSPSGPHSASVVNVQNSDQGDRLSKAPTRPHVPSLLKRPEHVPDRRRAQRLFRGPFHQRPAALHPSGGEQVVVFDPALAMCGLGIPEVARRKLISSSTSARSSGCRSTTPPCFFPRPCTMKRPGPNPPTGSGTRSLRFARTAWPARSSAASSTSSRSRGSAEGSARKSAATSSTVCRGRLGSAVAPVIACHSCFRRTFQLRFGVAARLRNQPLLPDPAGDPIQHVAHVLGRAGATSALAPLREEPDQVLDLARRRLRPRKILTEDLRTTLGELPRLARMPRLRRVHAA